MKNFLSIVALLLVVSMSAYAKVYSFEEIKQCEPKNNEQLMFCDLNNIPITGEVQSFYSNGNLESEAKYKDGKTEGVAKIYYENGNLKSEVNYKDGKMFPFDVNKH